MVHRVNLVSNLILLACIIASPVFAFSLTQRKSLDVVVRGSHSQLVRRSDTAVYGSIIKQRLTFNSPPGQYGKEIPKLILISGCPGTGKSTFGMSLALEQGILKCISTETVRAVMHPLVPESISPPLHRWPATDDGTDDPVKSWIETCKVLDSSVDELVDDAIRRNVSLVIEGVSLLPSKKLIDRFNAAGGLACGVLLVVSDEEVLKNLLLKRGFKTGNKGAEENNLESFDRVRLIQDEMKKLAKESGWGIIEQRVDPDPLDVVANELFKASACRMKDALIDELEEDCVLNFKSTDSKPAINDRVRAEKENLEVAEAEKLKEQQLEI